MSTFTSLYFQVHQPYRLKDLRVTHIGAGEALYFDDEKNRAIFRKVAEKCYLPANAVLLELLRHNKDFAVSFSISGVFLDQCHAYGEDVLDSFRALAKTEQVEFLAETYYHSLSAVASLEEFCAQVKKHADAIEELFGKRPTILRNTELIYRNELAEIARRMGFRGILAEGADALLRDRTANIPYTPAPVTLNKQQCKQITAHRVERHVGRHAAFTGKPQARTPKDMHVLLKNYRLSDDVAFRFSDKSWIGFPLFTETFAQWIAESPGHCVNLFMDYETFGEHQWADTGIFDFLRTLPDALKKKGVRTLTVSDVLKHWKPGNEQIFDAPEFMSWADTERDLSAWQGNEIQRSALQALYALETAVKATGDLGLLETWRRLQTSDHFYYMCTKYWNDGDVHKYFSPYDSPYEAYRRFSHALCDLQLRLEKHA